MLFGFGKMNKTDVLNAVIISSKMEIEEKRAELEAHRELFHMIYPLSNKEIMGEMGEEGFSYMGKRALALLEIEKKDNELTELLEAYKATKERVVKEMIFDLENGQVENCE